ncbi:transglutaminase domain-containing protein [Acaryochloris sp. 'Moss Beach']|uniref:transglutaminase-like domain-containing protein n=1 Tax=Acaryochloris sp. 'Moss Beach' TaxID=2740837 RepID=UPI001F44FA6D|nr:transglutaminase-like domain-containing protein [Acaryochloris sp. 'Moss Beach']UJB69472.1 transglutaminase domain-containing protein [Acaryochloris sp. 'Moss Beach']
MGLRLLRRYDALQRLITIDNLNTVWTKRSTLPAELSIPEFKNQDHLQLLHTVNNFVTKIEPDPHGNVEVLYHHAKQNGGLCCFGMAALYFHALCLNHIKARLVILKRNIFDPYDSHTTVEVRCDDRWIIFDPTFMVSFEQNDQLVGAQDIHQALQNGNGHHIRPITYGSGAYPAQLDNYYIHWLPLFNNVFVMNALQLPSLTKLPPWRFWLGPISYCQQPTCDRNYHLKFHQNLYIGVVVIQPILVMLMSSALWGYLFLQYFIV